MENINRQFIKLERFKADISNNYKPLRKLNTQAFPNVAHKIYALFIKRN